MEYHTGKLFQYGEIVRRECVENAYRMRRGVAGLRAIRKRQTKKPKILLKKRGLTYCQLRFTYV